MLAILAAILYSLSAPFSKLLLSEIPALFLSGLLYLGASVSMILVFLFRKIKKEEVSEVSLEKEELPYVISMVILDVLAPVSLLIGLKMVNASTAALLNNFEIVATSLVAFFIFKESISKRLFIGILLVTISCIILSVSDFRSITFNFGSLLVVLATIFWGFENNCTRKLSKKDPLQIVFIKGVFSGIISLLLGFITKEKIGDLKLIILAIILGMLAYGMSIFLYVYAQRYIGASRTSAYYAIAPFVSTLLSFVILKESITSTFIVALVIMIFSAILCENDNRLFNKREK